MRSLSDLSVLTTSTAVEINQPQDHPTTGVETAVEVLSTGCSTAPLHVLLTLDDQVSQMRPQRGNGVCTDYGPVRFTIAQENHPEFRLLILGSTTELPMEFFYIAQVRIRTGSQQYPITKVVDKDVFQFTPYTKPLVVKIADARVTEVHFEMRFINKVQRSHPVYDEGDVVIAFSDGQPIKTFKSLLALHSDYMRDILIHVPNGGVVDVSPCPRQDFISLLNFIYPTRMPIYRNFKGLVRAALAFQVNTVLYACSRHFVDYPECTFEYKLQEAISLELVPALEELVYRCYQSGLWTGIVSMGFNPEVACGTNVYRKIVCPIILKAKSGRFGQSVLHSPWTAPDFFTAPTQSDEWMFTNLVLLGTPFYVNAALLAIYGREIFGSIRGEIVANVTQDFRDACVQVSATPGEVVLSLLTSLYPLSPPVPSRLVRPAIIFAHHHSMHIVVEELEQLLLTEPPESAVRLLDNFWFAEKYNLQNLLRTNLQRVEGSCQVMASEIVELPNFCALSQETQDLIIDRVCSGWGLHNCMLVKKQPTRHRTRSVTLDFGGPRRDAENGPETFHSMHSAEIFGDVHEMRVVN